MKAFVNKDRESIDSQPSSSNPNPAKPGHHKQSEGNSTASTKSRASPKSRKNVVPAADSNLADSEMSADDEGPHSSPLSPNQNRTHRHRRVRPDSSSKKEHQKPIGPPLRTFVDLSRSASSSISENSAQPAPVGSNPRMKLGSSLDPYEIPERKHKITKSNKEIVSVSQAIDSSGLTVTGPQDLFHLMKVTQGRIHGHVSVRLDSKNEWQSVRCSVKNAGKLVCEDKKGVSLVDYGISDLRGLSVFALLEETSGAPIILIRSADNSKTLQFRIKKQSMFDSWFAALLCWHAVPSNQTPNTMDQRRWNLASPLFSPEHSFSRRAAVVGTKSDPAILLDQFREAAEIFPYAGEGSASTENGGCLSKTYRTPVTCVVDEHGNLKIYNRSKQDSSLALMIQLSNFPRSAVQRIDRRVFNQDHIIGIFPQYAFSNDAASQVRPVYLSFTSIDKFELWFVLLKAFANPELFGFDSTQSEYDFGQVNDILPGIDKKPSSMFSNGSSLAFRINRANLFSENDTSEVLESHGEYTSASGARPQSSRSSSSYGYYAEILIDEQPKARTQISQTCSWYETLFVDHLSTLFSTVSVRVGKYNPNWSNPTAYDPDSWTSPSTTQPELSNAEIYEYVGGTILEAGDAADQSEDADHWRPITGKDGLLVGKISLHVNHKEETVLREGAYDSIMEELQDFENMLTVKIWRHIPLQLPRLAETFLNIFLSSGHVEEWLITLAETEVTNGPGNSRNSLKHSSQLSEVSVEPESLGQASISEASILFRANTLFTKALDLYMKRVGMTYLEQTIGSKLRQIMREEVNCEVDPSKMTDASEEKIYRHWQRLHELTAVTWDAIYCSASKCPMELRRVFRHIRNSAEARYGSIMPSVSYSSISGFLFLRFFCAAVMTPQLFGLVKDMPGPNATRTFLLIAKSLQGLANMTTFGAKEPWMSPMNTFCSTNRKKFKEFLDSLCEISSASKGHTQGSTAVDKQVYFRTESLQVDEYLSDVLYSLDPRARESLPSIPYLIDRPYSLAVLVDLWLDNFDADDRTPPRGMKQSKEAGGASVVTLKTLNSLIGEDRDLARFHAACQSIRYRVDATSYAKLAHDGKPPTRRSEYGTSFMTPTVMQAWVKIAEHMERVPEEYMLKEEPAPFPVRPKPPPTSGPMDTMNTSQRPISGGGRSEISPSSRPAANSASSGRSQHRPQSSESHSSPEASKKKSPKKKPPSPQRGPEETAMRKLGWM